MVIIQSTLNTGGAVPYELQRGTKRRAEATGALAAERHPPEAGRRGPAGGAAAALRLQVLAATEGLRLQEGVRLVLNSWSTALYPACLLTPRSGCAEYT